MFQEQNPSQHQPADGSVVRWALCEERPKHQTRRRATRATVTACVSWPLARALCASHAVSRLSPWPHEVGVVCVPTLDRGRAWFRERKDLPEATQLWITSKQTFRCADEECCGPRGQGPGIRAQGWRRELGLNELVLVKVDSGCAWGRDPGDRESRCAFGGRSRWVGLEPEGWCTEAGQWQWGWGGGGSGILSQRGRSQAHGS